jgi:hypothetical protein
MIPRNPYIIIFFGDKNRCLPSKSLVSKDLTTPKPGLEGATPFFYIQVFNGLFIGFRRVGFTALMTGLRHLDET